jgi:hypothetical protein
MRMRLPSAICRWDKPTSWGQAPSCKLAYVDAENSWKLTICRLSSWQNHQFSWVFHIYVSLPQGTRVLKHFRLNCFGSPEQDCAADETWLWPTATARLADDGEPAFCFCGFCGGTMGWKGFQGNIMIYLIHGEYVYTYYIIQWTSNTCNSKLMVPVIWDCPKITINAIKHPIQQP